jgi:DNA-binding MarR family transcriptional regulator
MTIDKDKLKFLEQTTLPRIMVYLLEKNKASRTDLVHNISGSQGAIYNALPILKNMKFIDEKTSDGFPRRKDVWLTDRGKTVAKSLADLIEFLSKNP